MHFSLNEIESMGKRAAYGANWYWGIAEEAGKASRWLAAHGLPGPEMLADVLLANEGKPYEELLPRMSEDIWRARSGILCPLLTGAALSDRSAKLSSGYAFQFEAVAFPLLLAPYAAMSAKAQNAAIALSWKDAYLVISADGGLAVEGDNTSVTGVKAESVSCGLAREDVQTTLAKETGRSVAPKAWEQLDSYATRAFAPSTDVSRMSAGAGFEDND